MKNYPIRVLNLFTIMNRGGAETMCMNLLRNIDRTKVQFDFLVYYAEEGHYDKEIESLGGRIYRIPKLAIPSAIQHWRGAVNFFKAHPEYDIVHDHMGCNGAFIVKAAEQAGVKTIIYHSHFESEPILDISLKVTVRHLVNEILYRSTIKHCNQYFACGGKSAKMYGFPLEKIHILKNAINIENFQYTPSARAEMRKELGVENAFVIGNVARFEIMKNHKFLLAIFKEIHQRMPEAKLLLVGDGSFRDELKAQAEQYGITQNVIFTGVRQDVNKLLQAMDVFLFPSIREGLPVSCIEAQASGLPCVFSDGFDHETAVTDDCHFISLEEPVEKWADVVLSYRDFQRKDTSDIIRAAGYDIHETSKMMANYYLGRIE